MVTSNAQPNDYSRFRQINRERMASKRRQRMSQSMKVAFGCHLLNALVLIIFALVYLFRPEFMPYHADAVAREWSNVEYPYQVLILALMRATGGAWLATAMAMLIILFIPFRQGYNWARWAIPVMGMVVSASTFCATNYVRQNTPGNPPGMIILVGIVLSVLGLVVSLQADNN